MNRHLCLVVGVWVLVAAQPAKEDPSAAERKKFEGTWKVVKAERDGEAIVGDKLNALKVIVTGEKINIRDGRNDDSATIKLDPTKQPATIDFLPSDGEKPALGIYQWDGETLKLCWGKSGGVRPKEFSSRSEAETVLFVLERMK